jgi:D-serine dehydratase
MVTNESALAAPATCFGTAAGLHVAITNKTTVARATAADGAAIGLAVWVLNKAAVALLGVCAEAC